MYFDVDDAAARAVEEPGKEDDDDGDEKHGEDYGVVALDHFDEM